MATTPINGSKMINPLFAPKTPDGGKAKASDKIDPATLLKTDGASVNAQSQKGALATDVTISPSAKRTAEERMKAFSIANMARLSETIWRKGNSDFSSWICSFVIAMVESARI